MKFFFFLFRPSVALFTQLLNIVEELRKKSSSAVFSFLKTVLAKSFPRPGDTLSIRTFENEIFEIKRSDTDFLLEYVTCHLIFFSLSPISTVVYRFHFSRYLRLHHFQQFWIYFLHCYVNHALFYVQNM